MLNEDIIAEKDSNAMEKPVKITAFEPIITDSRNAARVLEENKILYEGDIELGKIGFCKIETQQGCLIGSFCIPKLLDVQGSRYRILFFITRDNIVLVDDDDFSKRIVNRINRRKTSQYKTKEIFLFNFIAEFINRDLEMLVQFEKKLMQLEENENRYFGQRTVPLSMLSSPAFDQFCRYFNFQGERFLSLNQYNQSFHSGLPHVLLRNLNG